MSEPKKAKGGHAGPIALENAIIELVRYGKQVEWHREAIQKMERKPMAERIAALRKAAE